MQKRLVPQWKLRKFLRATLVFLNFETHEDSMYLPISTYIFIHYILAVSMLTIDEERYIAILRTNELISAAYTCPRLQALQRSIAALRVRCYTIQELIYYLKEDIAYTRRRVGFMRTNIGIYITRERLEYERQMLRDQETLFDHVARQHEGAVNEFLRQLQVCRETSHC